MKNLILPKMAVVAFFLLLVLSPKKVKAQASPVDPQTAAALQTKLDYLVSYYNLKGLSASVIIPGKGTWNGASGFSHGNVPIDTAMVFAVGSITKNFTAAGILLLQQDGLLSLSDSLKKFLPAYPNVNPNITLKQLLQHTSGIYNYFNHPSWISAVNNFPGQAMTPQFVLNNYVNAPVFAPGATHEYSNTNYLLLGLVIQAVSGQSYAAFIRQRLLNPLQLTSFYVSDHEPARGVKPHNWTAPNPMDPGTDIFNLPITSIFGTSAADGALVGNANDLARYGQLLFTGQVLQSASQQLMTQFIPISIGGNVNGYGLGLMRFGTGNAIAWGHSGGIRGFASSLMFSTTDGIVVSLLSNKTAEANTLAWSLLTTARQQALLAAPGDAEGLRDALVCFPNPAQENGSIQYILRKTQQVEITLQNSLGQTVRTLLQQPKEAGEHSLLVDTSNLPAGLYLCTLQTESKKLVQRWVITQ